MVISNFTVLLFKIKKKCASMQNSSLHISTRLAVLQKDMEARLYFHMVSEMSARLSIQIKDNASQL